MISKVYTVYDSKVEAYMTPFFMRGKGEALRAWASTVNDSQTQFCKHPSDFTLFEIGEYDDTMGVIKMYEAKISLGLALDYKEKAEDSLPLVEHINSIKKEK